MLRRQTSCAGLLALFMATIHAEDLKDVEYARAGKVSLRFDAHIPNGPGPFAAAILVHGGAWVAGDRANNVNIEPLLKPLSDAGLAWFSISYRLAADVARNPIGAALHLGTAESDVRRAVIFVKEHASEYRVNPSKVVLIGQSAGGQLASMAALRPGADGAVAGVVGFYTPSDLVSLAATSSFIPDGVRDAAQGTAFENVLKAGLTKFSPINAVSEKAPPFLLIHGTDDNVVPFAQSERFCEKLRASNVACELYAVKGGGHGAGAWESLRLTDYKSPMIRWLQKTVAQP
jgi:acetyl esterase